MSGDFADQASDTSERQLADALAAHQVRERILPTGHCYNCEEPLTDREALFCDSDCREDYERLNLQKVQKLHY